MIPIETIPTVFRDGYEKAYVMNPKLADLYIKHTMLGDPIADAAVEALADVEPRRAHHFIQAAVDQRLDILKNAPQEVRDLYEELDHIDSQFDKGLGRIGTRAFFKDSDMFLLVLVAVGLVDNFATLIGKSFLMTGYTTQDSIQRLRQSLRQVIESMLPGGLERYGDGWRLTIRARFAHAQARRNLLQSGNWDTETFGMPVSAAHVAYATIAFSALVLNGVDKLGVALTPEQREGYIHVWHYIGWLVGVPTEVLLKNETDGMALLRIGRACEPPPNVESILMAHTLINSAALTLGVDKEDKEQRDSLTNYGYRISRALIGDKLADQLDFPKHSSIGLLAGFRWKRHIERMFGLVSPTARGENFMTLLEATELGDNSIKYDLQDRRHE